MALLQLGASSISRETGLLRPVARVKQRREARDSPPTRQIPWVGSSSGLDLPPTRQIPWVESSASTPIFTLRGHAVSLLVPSVRPRQDFAQRNCRSLGVQKCCGCLLEKKVVG